MPMKGLRPGTTPTIDEQAGIGYEKWNAEEPCTPNSVEEILDGSMCTACLPYWQRMLCEGYYGVGGWTAKAQNEWSEREYYADKPVGGTLLVQMPDEPWNFGLVAQWSDSAGTA